LSTTGGNSATNRSPTGAAPLTSSAAQLGFTYFLLLTHVHDDQDPNFTFPAWISEPRGGHDGRGTYAAVAASSPDTAN